MMALSKTEKKKHHRLFSWLRRDKKQEDIEPAEEERFFPPEFDLCDAEGETTILSRNCRSGAEGETTVLSRDQRDETEGETTVLSRDQLNDTEGETTILSQRDLMSFEGESETEEESRTTFLDWTEDAQLQEETEPDEDERPAQEIAHEQQTDNIGATQLLAPSENSGKAVYGCVVRARTGDVINITSSIFRFGAYGGTSEYQVNNNPRISRNHATLFVEGRHYFIMDGGSTNGTFLEGMRLQPFQKTEIISGSLFSIADEVFQFFAGKE